jgi:GDPmannose 4,6-dehydratase
MWLMLQQENPEDFVLATGEVHTVRELVEITAVLLGYKIRWEGSGVNEKGYDVKSGNLLVEVDPQYFRPSEVDYLLGDPKKSKDKLGWKPKVKFEELIKIMVDHRLCEYPKNVLSLA